jgi:hypothetical protein
MRGSTILLMATLTGVLAAASHAQSLRPSADASHAAGPVAVCSAPSPASGQRFTGTVLQVIDGETLCLAQGPTPADWIRVSVAGAPRDARRSALAAAAFGRVLSCVALRDSPSGVVADCAVAGAAVNQLIMTKAVRLQGQSWR